MTIKTINIYNRAGLESLGSNLEGIHDERVNFNKISDPNMQAFMINAVRNGTFPTTKQPEDSVVWTDTECIVTTVWLDRAAAEQHCVLKQNSNLAPELISATVVED